jgi:hypothetical protein
MGKGIGLVAERAAEMVTDSERPGRDRGDGGDWRGRKLQRSSISSHYLLDGWDALALGVEEMRLRISTDRQTMWKVVCGLQKSICEH